MAVTSNKLLRAYSGGVDTTNRGVFTVGYRFACDSDMGALGVLNGALSSTPHALPNFGDSYDYETELGAGEIDPTSFARDFDVEFDESNRRQGTITVSYAPLAEGENYADVAAYNTSAPAITFDPGGSPLQGSLSLTATPGARPPWSRGAKWYAEEEEVAKPLEKDKDGNPVVNAANKSFDRPPVIEDGIDLLIAEFAVPDLRTYIDLRRTYSKAVNSSAWTLFTGTGFTNPATRQVLCRYVRCGRGVTERGFAYYPVQMGFAIKPDSEVWDVDILNEGYGYLDAPDGDYVKAVDSSGATVSEPVLLAADGTKLPDDTAGNFVTVRGRKEVNFNDASLANYLKPTA